MRLEEVRTDFHELIDHVNDAELLSQFYDAINRSVQPGSLWMSLTKEQQQGVLDAFEESEHDENLITYSEIQAKYKK